MPGALLTDGTTAVPGANSDAVFTVILRNAVFIG